MNCKSFRKYAGAFADGELDVPLNLEALEHLNMCAACARRVDDITSSKQALANVWSREVAPETLRRRVSDSVYHTVEQDDAPDHSLAHKPSWRRRSTLMIPLALAAAVLFYVSIWQRWRSDDLFNGTMTVVAAQAVADIRNQHQDCVLTRGIRHHNPLLSRQPALLAGQLSGLTDMTVMVPQFPQQDFELVGGEKCGIQGRVGAHVLYRSTTTNEFLSVFTSTRIVELIPNQPTRWRKRAYFATEDDHPLTVVAWHESDRTISIAAHLPKKTLLELANGASLAARAPSAIRLVSAKSTDLN